MKQNRDMFYSDFNYGGSTFPNMGGPNMFSGSSNMMVAGPNVNVPIEPNQMYNNNNLEVRVDKLERQVKRIETKISNLENNSNVPDVEVNSSMYMI